MVNASNISKDWNWLNECNEQGAVLENDSGNLSQLAVQGPKATAILQKITLTDLSKIGYFQLRHRHHRWCG